MPRETTPSYEPQATPDYKTTFSRQFIVNDAQKKLIMSRLNDTAPAAITKRLAPSPKRPLGGYVRLLPNYSMYGEKNNIVFIEVRKCTGFSQNRDRSSVH